MSILSTVKEMGYSVRIEPKEGRLGVTPWSTCPEEHRQWFKEHKQEIIDELKKQPAKSKPVKPCQSKERVGTTLKKLIEKKVPSVLMAKIPKASCGCQDYEKKMNAWGVSGCIARKNEIVNHLMKQSEMLGIAAKVVPTAVKQKAAGKMVDIAIKIESKKR